MATRSCSSNRFASFHIEPVAMSIFILGYLRWHHRAYSSPLVSGMEKSVSKRLIFGFVAVSRWASRSVGRFQYPITDPPENLNNYFAHQRLVIHHQHGPVSPRFAG